MGKGCGEGWGTTKTETTANVRAQSGPASPGRGREEFPSSCKDVSSKYAQARYRARRGLGKGKGVPCPLMAGPTQGGVVHFPLQRFLACQGGLQILDREGSCFRSAASPMNLFSQREAEGTRQSPPSHSNPRPKPLNRIRRGQNKEKKRFVTVSGVYATI